jgi:hypothetical protein
MPIKPFTVLLSNVTFPGGTPAPTVFIKSDALVGEDPTAVQTRHLGVSDPAPASVSGSFDLPAGEYVRRDQALGAGEVPIGDAVFTPFTVLADVVCAVPVAG